ncbi:hypothetical protein CU254_21095 [Amycolatopsis sp. AA4]|uniref:hypothetical protein n=1 Tax=Actinomycetes TaxID=1760 RepID=UPI0001B56078|nr:MULTISPECIES: hypothetical protein [Actinomycetes]ATY12676.1 hypothetical protein CU254_21095 [Amycolatopsis sp. AA4]EFL08480.1 predicted protein [Streptomyces sp. AA4]
MQEYFDADRCVDWAANKPLTDEVIGCLKAADIAIGTAVAGGLIAGSTLRAILGGASSGAAGACLSKLTS